MSKKASQRVVTAPTNAAAADAQVVQAAQSLAVMAEAPQGRETKDERIRRLMSAAIATAAQVEAGLKEQQDKRGAGVYAILTACAASDPQTFDACWTRTKADMQGDVGGCATAAGLRKTKGGAYKLPSAACSAASTLNAAIEWGVGLTDILTGKPLAFNKIRNGVNEKRAELLEAGADEGEKALFACRAALAVLVGQLTQIVTKPLEKGEGRISDRLDSLMLEYIDDLTSSAHGFSLAYSPPEVTEEDGATDADMPEDDSEE